MRVRSYLPTLGAALMLASCASYQPLRDTQLYHGPMRAPSGTGISVTYFGNTTILISDGETKLLVDGFFSRPPALRVARGRVQPDPAIIAEQLALGAVGRVTAVLVGHSHYDHALDAPTAAYQTGAFVIGSESYAKVHEGAGGRASSVPLEPVPVTGYERHLGKFTIRFRLSEHVPPHLPGQEKMTGQIIAPVETPAPATDYKHGDVFVLHIEHPDGRIAITTTAGARRGQFDGLRADVVMLAVGLLAEEPPQRQDFYWNETVEALQPHTVIPVHWDDFTAGLDRHATITNNLRASPLRALDNTQEAMTFVKRHANGRKVWVMGLRDSFALKCGVILPSS